MESVISTGRSAGRDHFPSYDWLTPFRPPAWLRGGHAQTLAGNYWRRPPFTLEPEAHSVEVDPADGSRILCHCHWQPERSRAARLTLLLVHGLEGSSSSGYMRGIAARAFEAGCNVIRMNMRNCGGTETWTPTLYHSGLSGDVHSAAAHFVRLHGLTRVAVAGYSMGGNLVLKLAGEVGKTPPVWLRAAVAVSPAADLAASADALHKPANRLYERHFLRNLMVRFRRKAQIFPGPFDPQLTTNITSLREFDDRITARYSGFSGADDYYFRAAAARVVSRIRIPTLILHALDDPFIRVTAPTREALLANSSIALVETAHGGHCAFLASVGKPAPGAVAAPRHWAEATLVGYLLATVGHADGS